MNREYSIAVLFSIVLLLSGCSKQATNSNVQTGSPALALGEKARLVEERIVNGEAISENDVAGLSQTELRILRNGSFARHGRKYDSPGLGDYFNNRSWYKPRDDYSDTALTASDRANVRIILAVEQGTSRNESTTVAGGSSEAVTQQVGITREKVAKAINEIMNRKVQESKSGGGLAVFHRIQATVSGIQEGAQEARAFLSFEIDWQGYVTGRSTGHSNGEAIISRFNDGRWVITKITSGNMYLGAWNENYEIR